VFQNQSESILFANLLQNTLNELFGTAEKPRLGKKFYLLKKLKMSSSYRRDGLHQQ
jgi:N-acetylmuramoyl-L-alanine amidase